MFILTRNTSDEAIQLLQANWGVVAQDHLLMKHTTLNMNGPPTPDGVIVSLLAMLNMVLTAQFRGMQGPITATGMKLVTEEASEASITFRGETKDHRIPGMTRLAGVFECEGRTVTVRPTWVGHPFWQYRHTATKKKKAKI